MSYENSNVTGNEVVPPRISPKSASKNHVTEDLWTFDSREDDDDDIDLEELSRAFSEAASLASHPKKKSDTSRDATVEPSTVSRTSRVVSDNVPGMMCVLQKNYPLNLVLATKIYPAVCKRKWM